MWPKKIANWKFLLLNEPQGGCEANFGGKIWGLWGTGMHSNRLCPCGEELQFYIGTKLQRISTFCYFDIEAWLYSFFFSFSLGDINEGMD